VTLVDTTARQPYARIGGLGDLSHASAVYSRDGRYAFVFGRDGGLTKIDMLEAKDRQARHPVRQRHRRLDLAGWPHRRRPELHAGRHQGLRCRDARTAFRSAGRVRAGPVLQGRRPCRHVGQPLRLRAVRRRRDPRDRFQRSEAAGDAALPGRQPALRRAGDARRTLLPGRPVRRGRRRHARSLAAEKGARKILENYGRGEEKLPVFKMPHLRGWSVAQGKAYLPAIGRHEVLVVDVATWKEVGRIPVRGQPVFVMARPDGRQVWVNFAFPDNGKMDVIDTLAGKVVHAFEPGKGILHMEFTPRGENVWLSARDDNKVLIYDTTSFARVGEIAADSPSGIFFTTRAARIGF
jgi:protein NirF